MSATRKFRTDLTAANRGALRSATALGRVLTVAAAATTMGAEGVKAGPKGGVVKAGSATITTRGGATTINQAGQKVVIDWDSFDIDANDAVNFLQPGKDSIALNRVLNDLPTNIRGQLTANGNVWIVNQHGVTFHAGAMVNVGSLIATTADIDNADFMAGNYKFDKPGDPNAKIINEGDITFGEAGLAAFVAPSAANRGVIAGRMGKVVIAGNETFAVDLAGDGMWAFTMGEGANAASASNSGRIHNPGGYILISARAAQGMVDSNISVGGVVEATTAKVEGGKIVLSGDGFVEVSGELDATGAEAGQVGGSIEVTGDKVHVTATAKIDASGDAGGGSIKIGGDYQGGRALKTASRTLVSEGAEIAASAIGQVGDGGEVIVWADEITGFFGSIRATGGANAGDGGFAEVSGKQQLAFDGWVDLTATNGLTGELLLDPVDIVIVDGAGADDAELADFTILAADPGATFTISNTAIETALGTSSVTITASNSITQDANAAIDFTASANNLSLSTTSGAILLQSTIDAGAGGLTLNAGGDLTVSGAIVSAGALDFDAGSSIILNSAISSTSGGVSLTANTALTGTVTFGSTVNGGDVDVTTMAAVALGDVSATGSLTVTSGGAITDQGAMIEAQDLASFTAGDDINIDTLDTHVFNSGVSLNADQIIRFAATGTLGLNSVSTTNMTDVVNRITATGGMTLDGAISTAGVSDLTLDTTNGNVLQSAGSLTTDALSLNTGTGDATFVVGTNDINTLLATSAGDISLTDTDGVTVGSVDAGALTIVADDVIDQVALSTITLTGLADLTTTGDVVMLAEGGNDFASVTVDTTGGGGSAANVSITEANDAAFGGITAASLTISAGGNVTQTETTTITVTGTTTLSGVGSVTLDEASNDFAAVTGSIGGVSLQDVNAITVEALTATAGSVTMLAASGVVVATNADVSATDDVSLSASNFASQISLSGTSQIIADSDLNMDGDVTLSVPSGFLRLLSFNSAVSGANVTMDGLIVDVFATTTAQAGNVDIDADLSADVLGEVRATAPGAIVSIDAGNSIGITTIDADVISVESSSRGINQAGGTITTASGTTVSDFTAATYVTLNQTGNDFGGPTALSGQSLTISDTNALILDTVTATGAIMVNAGGAVTQNGVSKITAIQTATITATGQNIDLSNDNNFLSTFVATGAAVSVKDANAIELGAITASTLTVEAGGAVSQSAGAAVANETTVTAAGQVVDLDNAANAFTGVVNVTGGAVEIDNTIALALGDITATTLDAVAATGDVTNAAGDVLSVTGTTTITATAGAINLAGEVANEEDLRQTVTLSAAGDISLTGVNAQKLVLGEVTSTTGTVTVDVAEAIDLTGNVSASAGGDAVTLRSAGDLTQTAGAISASELTVDSGGNAVSLTSATNAVDTLTLGVNGAVNVVEADGLAVGQETGGGQDALTLRSGAAITQASSLTVTNNADLITEGASITLNAVGNAFGSVSADTTYNMAAANSVTINEADATVISGITATSATVTSGGAISQTGVVGAPANSSFTASGDINLTNAANDFADTGSGSTAAFSGVTVNVTDADTLALGAVTSSASTTITADDAGASGNFSGGLTELRFFDTDGDMVLTSALILPATVVNFTADSAGAIDAQSLTLTNATTLLDAATSATFSTGAGTFAALTVNAPGGVYQTAPITVTGATDLNAPASQIALANAANDFQGRVDADASRITLYDANNLELALINSDTLVANAGGDITDQGAQIEARTYAGFTAGDDILIDTLDTHVFGDVSLSADQITHFAATGSIGLGPVTATNMTDVVNRITVTDGVTLDGAISTAGLSDLTLETTNGNVLQQSGALTTDALTLDLGTGDGTFVAGTNDINTLAAVSADDISLTDTDGVTIATVDASTLTVTAGAAIDQQAMSTVTLSGLADLTATGANITLNEATNDFAAIDAEGADLTFRDANGVELTDIDASGALSVTALGGDITDGDAVATPAGSDVNVAGTTTLVASGAITLDDATNDFGGAVSADGQAIILRDANSIILGDIDASGALLVEAISGGISQDGDGAIGGDINAAAGASFTASTNIALTDALNDFVGAVTADGADVSLTDLNAIELADIDAATLTVAAASIDDGGAGAPGGDINVSGETMLTASAAITLDDALNDFGGVVTASGTAITLRDANSIVLGDIDAGGVLTVDAIAGAISQDGDGAPGADINAAAEASFTASTTITLTDASNDFAGIVNADGSAVSINDLNAIELGDIDAASLAVTAGATIDDGASSMGANADIDVTGTTTLTALGAITLDDASNNFGQAVSADGGAVVLRDADNIILGDVLAGGDLTVTAAGAITDSANSTVTVTGATTLTASDNGAYFDIALDNDTAAGRHDFGGAVTAIGQDITLIGRSGVTLGAITTNGGAPDDTINVDGGAEATDPGELIVIARGGAITQDAGSALTVTGDATLEAADGAGGYFDITLTNTQNAFDSDNTDAVGDGDAATDSVTFLGETVAITDTGPLLVIDSVANAGGALTAQTGDLTIERLRVNAANGPLVGIAQDGAIDADDLSGGSITLGGAGSVDGAATAATGVVTVDNFAVGALAAASDVSTILTNGDAGAGLEVEAPLQTFTFVTADAFTDGAATDFNALTGSTADQLILERMAFDGDITIAAGDVDLGHIDADDGFFVTALTGDVSKRADADLDFAGSTATGFTVAGARGAADEAITLQSFDTLLRVGGAASFNATGGDVVITRGQTGGGAKEVDLQGPVSIAATDAAIEDQNSLILGQVAVGDTLAIRINTDNANAAAETLTQTATQTITVGGDLALITGVGDTDRSDVTLATTGNSFNTISALAGGLSIGGGDAFTLQNSDLTGGLTIGSAADQHGGDLTLQDVQLGGDLAFDATGATTLIRLDVAGVTGRLGAGLTVNDLSTAGDVSLTTTGGAITVTDAIIGAFDFDSAGALTITNLSTSGSAAGISTAAGNIAIANITSDTNASFDSTGGALDIDSARIGSTLTLSASGDVTLGAIATGADLSATSDTASVLIRDAATEAPADFTVDGVQTADIGFASGPLVGDIADNRVIETVTGTADQTVEPADFTLQLAIGGDAAFNAAGSVLLPREAAAEGGLQNDFTGDVAISAASGDVVIEDANALSFATVTITAGDLSARSNADNTGAGEGITQTAAIAVGGTASFVTGDHGGAPIADEAILADVTLGSALNDFTGAVTVIADNATLADANAITVAAARVANTLSIDATSAGAGDVAALTDTQSGGATTVISGGGVDLDQVTVGGALTATGQGAGLTANDLAVTGATTLTAATTIAVEDALLADATITAGASGALSNVSARVINVETGGVTISGLSAAAATITSTGAGDAALTDLNVTGATDVTAGGDVSLDDVSLGATTVTAGGDLSLTDGQIAGVTLNSGGSLNGSNLRTGQLDVAAAGDVTLDAMQVAGDAAILSTDGDIGLGSVAVAGRLTAESGAGAIRTIDSDFALDPVTVAGSGATAPTLIGAETNTNLLSVGGDAYFMAAGDIALVDDEAGVTGDNDFMGGVTAISGGSVILNDANDLVIGAPTGVARPGGRRFTSTGITAAGSLRIDARGAITDADAPQATVAVGGDARLLAGGDILLDNETHAIGGAVAARGQNITLTEVGAITLGPINASGDLMVEAGANNAARGGTTGDAAILQARAVTVANADVGAETEDETIGGAIRVTGASTFTTGLARGFALSNSQLTGNRDLVLDSPANNFEGRLDIARIAGDATITENSQNGAVSGEQRIGNFEIGGTTRLTTTDNVIFIGRMTALLDDAEPEDPLPSRPDDVAARGQGVLGIADEDLRLFIATGESLIIDTTGGQNADGRVVRRAGANVRFDRAIDGDNDALPLGGPSIGADREGLGGLNINAGANGEIRFRDFVGAAHPLGDVTLSAGDIFAGFTFQEAQPDLVTADFTDDNRFLFDRLNQDDFFFARDLKVSAARRIEFLTPFRTVENFILLDQYFGVNIASLVFGGLEGATPVGPEIVQSFGFIGNDRSRATGLFPRGPQGGNFQFNDCVIGDVADCTNIPIPNVVNNILTPAPPLLGIDTEDLLELFGSFGNEELWGVPQSYYSDIGVEPENKRDCPEGSEDANCRGS